MHTQINGEQPSLVQLRGKLQENLQAVAASRKREEEKRQREAQEKRLSSQHCLLALLPVGFPVGDKREK